MPLVPAVVFVLYLCFMADFGCLACREEVHHKAWLKLGMGVCGLPNPNVVCGLPNPYVDNYCWHFLPTFFYKDPGFVVILSLFSILVWFCIAMPILRPGIWHP